MRYNAASIEATVKVNAYRRNSDAEGGFARREVTLTSNEMFSDDAELDLALDAFAGRSEGGSASMNVERVNWSVRLLATWASLGLAMWGGLILSGILIWEICT